MVINNRPERTRRDYVERWESWQLRLLGIAHRIELLDQQARHQRDLRDTVVRLIRRRYGWNFERLGEVAGISREQARKIVRAAPKDVGRVNARLRAAGIDVEAEWFADDASHGSWRDNFASNWYGHRDASD